MCLSMYKKGIYLLCLYCVYRVELYNGIYMFEYDKSKFLVIFILIIWFYSYLVYIGERLKNFYFFNKKKYYMFWLN